MQSRSSSIWQPRGSKGASTTAGKARRETMMPKLTYSHDDSSFIELHMLEKWERDDLVVDSSLFLCRSFVSKIGRSARHSGSHFQEPESLLHVESCYVAGAAFVLALVARDSRFLYIILVVAMGHVGVILLKWFNFYVDDDNFGLQLCIKSWGTYCTQAKHESEKWLSQKTKPGWGTAVSVYARYSYAASVTERLERKRQLREERLGYKVLQQCEDMFPDISRVGEMTSDMATNLKDNLKEVGGNLKDNFKEVGGNLKGHFSSEPQ